MAEPFIQVENLVKTFDTPAGPLSVLRGIDLTINKGEFVSLVGPSGSGKTTLLNMITGIDSPSDGEIVVDNVNVVSTPEKKLTRWRGRNVGIVFQFFQLLPTLTVLENIMMPMDFCDVYEKRERKDRAMVLLDRFGIANQAYKTPDMLSGGQQQRVAIARALANDPPLIVGDEPTGNLDRMSAQNVFSIFGDLASQGRTILVVTHDRELAGSGVARLLALTDGMVEATTLEAAARRRTQELNAIRVRTQERHAIKTASQEALAAKQQNQQ